METLRGRVLLGVFAHPDDESLACGGILARCADAGMKVVLLCATRGEDGEDRAEDRSPESLAAERTRELAAAADVLGVDSVMLLDFEDGMLPWEEGDDLSDAIGDAIARWSPHAVITFDEDGLYWHPDHIAVHHAATAAVAAADSNPPALYYVTIPEGAIRGLVDAVRDRVPSALSDVLGVSDADAFGTLAPKPELVVNVAEEAARKLAAIRCHRTQTERGPFSVLSDAEAARFLGTEQLRRAPVGNATEPVLELLQRG